MLNIIEGSFYSEVSEELRDRIKGLIESGKRAMLIVPEQQTVIAEKEMANILPESAPLAFEVTNFTRLANSVFRLLGGVDKEYCNSAKSALLMWRALSELAPMLSVTDGRREINYGMVKRALSTVSEADSLAVSADDLIAASEKIKSTERLDKKINDLIKISSCYKKLLYEKYADTGEDVSAAAKMITENPTAYEDTHFFIEGFTSFTEPQYKLISALISRCDLTAVLNIPKAMRDSFEYSELLLTEKRLCGIANKLSVNATLKKFDGIKRSREDLYEICSILWQTNSKTDNFTLQNPDSIRIFEATTPYEACDFLVSDIKRRVMDGASFSDFAVVTGDIGKYTGILDVSAKCADVPLFISAGKDLATYEAIKLILSALACVTGTFMREDVISYAKCGLSGIEREECDLFETYTQRWQISGERFTDGMIWNMHPDGYSPFRDEKTDEELIKIDQIKHKLIDPLTHLRDLLSGAETVTAHATALYGFIREISLFEKIAKRSEELYALGEKDAASESERLYKIICDSLDSLVEVCAEEKTDTEGFIAQLKILFSSASVSKIPSYSDSITAGSATMLRLFGKKHVYMLGVNRGEFPASISTESYFTDREKAELRSAGLPYEADQTIKEARELYAFSRAFSYADESVTLIYSTKTADFSAVKRADVIDRIIDITDKKVLPVRICDLNQANLVYSPREALLSLGRLSEPELTAVRSALTDSGYEKELARAESRLENSDIFLSSRVLSEIYKEDILLSQSKIDSYNTCPLAYFCRYDLGLSEEDRAEFDARNIGSFVHAVLENFFKIQADSKKDISELSEADKINMIEKGAEEYLARIMPDTNTAARVRLLISRLTRACLPIVNGLCEEFSGSGYLPKYFELRIGGRGEICPEMLKITDSDGSSTLIKGSIDRVDTYKFGDDVYVRVVDYKTGQKSFKPQDLIKGKNLQMFLYLSAVVDSKNNALHKDIGVGEGGKMIPAGVIYVKSDLSDVKISHASIDEEEKAVKADQKRQGMLLDDQVSIGAMNSSFLPIRLKANGEYYKGSEDKLFSEEGWQTLKDAVTDSVKRITRKMRSGNISAEPMTEDRSSPCSYCKFKPMCRNVKIK